VDKKRTGAYPSRRRIQRARDRMRTEQRVRIPIQPGTCGRNPILERRAGNLLRTLTWVGLAVGSLIVHAGFLAGSLLAGVALYKSGPSLPDRTLELSIAIQEPPAPPLPPEPPPAPPPPAPRARPESPRNKPEEAPEETPKEEEPAQALADPIDFPDNPRPPPPEGETPRRIVGLSLESTVTGTAGPSFAVGNTRMGQTDRVANAPANLPALPRSDAPGDAFEPPQRLRAITPVYPTVLKEKGIEGEVELSVDIDAKGEVVAVRVLGEPEHEEFAQMAIDAARKSAYSPAKRRGVPVSYTIQFTVRFRITEERG
jgi:periplasmic protein TonB